MSFKSLQDISDRTKNEHKEFWEIIIEDDMNERKVTHEESFERMRSLYHAMKHADTNYDETLRSPSGMSGGDGGKLEAFRKSNTSILNDFSLQVMEKAIKTSESNACMKRIVAAPTAGSCGIIPAVFLTYEEQKHTPEDNIIKALFVAAGIGSVIARNATISGAEGGCQAEIGSASAMAAGGLAYLEGGDVECILHSSALSLKNLLGLTCDPVAGLVEVPCIKRNVYGSINALSSAQLALAGIRSAIPPDEVIDTMKRIGQQMPACLRETSEGGLAITPTAQEIDKNMKKSYVRT
jgi:L-serine dehydratase